VTPFPFAAGGAAGYSQRPLLPRRRITSTRRLAAALFVSITLAGCGNDSSATGPSGGAGTGSSSGGVTFCEALAVIRDKCQRCHQSPPQHGAPVPFLTYEDIQAPYYTTDRQWSDAIADAVDRGTMPDLAQNEPPTSLMPPVEPLTADEQATLLDWLSQGAKAEGGTDCP
jgi:hypothetical protein